MLACCFRQTSKRHLLLWLTDGEDELDDESPSIKNQRRLAFSPSTNSYSSKPLMLPLFLFCFWLQTYHYFCSWTAVAGSFGCHFGGFFHVAPHFLSKISTPLETCVGQKLILTRVRLTCYSPGFVLYVHILHHLPAETYAVICLRLQIVMWESNPGRKQGRLVCCRYTTGALVREIFMDLLVLFAFLKALRASPLISLWGLTSYQLHLTFCFPVSSDFKPRLSVPLASVNWLFGLVA